MTSPSVKRALISVSDKSGLAQFAQGLVECGVEIYSTGGTRKFLQENGLEVNEVSAYTGFPEMMDGRLKTLHPKVFGGILCRHDNPSDMQGLEEHGILTFELVVVNLYPFQETVAKEGVTMAQAIEKIDIGGPSLVRAASKNHAFTTIATNASQYPGILAEIKANGCTSLETRTKLAAAAFAHTAEYDTAIAAFFAKQLGLEEIENTTGKNDPLYSKAVVFTKIEQTISIARLQCHFSIGYGRAARLFRTLQQDGLTQGKEPSFYHKGSSSSKQTQDNNEDFPSDLNLEFFRASVLRYGENPHQKGAYYIASDAAQSGNIVNAVQLNGKELSYNNLMDLDAALADVRFFKKPAVSVIKHNNPCGLAQADTLEEATRKAMEGDPLSAYGSILGVNRVLDKASAEYLAQPGHFIEAIAAVDFTPDALEILTTVPKWKNNVRLMKVGELSAASKWAFRPLEDGILMQEADVIADDPADWKVVTTAQPTDKQREDMAFAWDVCRMVKSNAITVAKDNMLLGAGAGQMNRVGSVEIAISTAGDRINGAVLASDAFFPFPDSVERIHNAGIEAIIQPGGSIRDQEVIDACNKYGIAMIFTGKRHFRH